MSDGPETEASAEQGALAADAAALKALLINIPVERSTSSGDRAESEEDSITPAIETAPQRFGSSAAHAPGDSSTPCTEPSSEAPAWAGNARPSVALDADMTDSKPSQRKKHHWSAEEDSKLVELILEHGAHKWSRIASCLPGRLGKQCRERWHNHLSPDLQKKPWSVEEDEIIIDAVQRLGTKWSEIVKLLPGRTDNSVKNRWNSSQRKILRREKKAALGSSFASVARRLDVADAARSHKPHLSVLAAAANHASSLIGLDSTMGHEALAAAALASASAPSEAPGDNQQRHLEAALAITALSGTWRA
jgi:hypothetical protein